jgi:hypothetical protein
MTDEPQQRINLLGRSQGTVGGKIYPHAADRLMRLVERVHDQQMRAVFDPPTTVAAGQPLTREHALILDAYRRSKGKQPWIAREAGKELTPTAVEVNKAVEWWLSWLAEYAPPACAKCRDRSYVPDWSNWNTEYGEPRPKPCPECQGGDENA